VHYSQLPVLHSNTCLMMDDQAFKSQTFTIPQTSSSENPSLHKEPQKKEEINTHEETQDKGEIEKQEKDFKIAINLKESKSKSALDKKMYEEIIAKDYKTLKSQLLRIAEEQGFDLAQNTGLKANKYAYFHCSHTEKSKCKNSNDSKKESKPYYNMCF